MWKEKLKEVKKVTSIVDMQYNDGTTKNELEKFTFEVREKFGYDLPEEYIDFLKELNGYEFNGCIIYGVDEKFLEEKPNQRLTGFIELSEIWYENEHQKQYIFMGEDNISWYVYDLARKKYIIVDNPGGSEMEYFDNFDQFMVRFFSDSINF